MTDMEPLPLFFSLNRFLAHDDHIGAGSVEICRATFDLGVVGEKNSEPTKITAEGKLDTCGSVSLSFFPLATGQRLQEIWLARSSSLWDRGKIQAIEGSRSSSCGRRQRKGEENPVLQI
jgi:hypothetical protein